MTEIPTLERTARPKSAFLISVYKANETTRFTAEEQLNELQQLCETFGIEESEKIFCPVKKFDAAILLGTGKLEELAAKAAEKNVEIVIFDDEISPAQQRNLEKVFKRPVVDRAEIILNIFKDRAHTHEAQLQVELARVQYQAPRLKRLWTHLERQAGTGHSGGGGKYLKGMGETQLEVDKRLLKQRIQRLREELEKVKASRHTQRQQRMKAGVPIVALVGYTNAGKSTLFNTLTDADTLTEDKLFATLDTTTRKWILPDQFEILLIDTVGFIRKLPHHLVAAFKSTLEEALFADSLVHMIDASHPQALEQAEATLAVLKELGADPEKCLTVLNKVDKIEDKQALDKLKARFPKALTISALNKQGLEELQKVLMQDLLKDHLQLTLRIPQSDYGVVAEIMREGRILHKEYDGDDLLIRVDLPSSYKGKISRYAT